jgi:hypothetical protein
MHYPQLCYPLDFVCLIPNCWLSSYTHGKVQVDFLQAKLSDESSRRARAEERSRVLKNYSEKAKVGTVGWRDSSV